MTIKIKEITLMDIFFSAFCGVDDTWQLPKCTACEFNIKGKGCSHPENPMNKIKEGDE